MKLFSFVLLAAVTLGTVSPVQAGGVIRDFRKARKAYRAWKKQNPAEASAALASAKAALERFKDQAVLDTVFSDQNASSVASKLEKVVNSSGNSRTMTCISGSDETTGAHIVAYGWKELGMCRGG